MDVVTIVAASGGVGIDIAGLVLFPLPFAASAAATVRAAADDGNPLRRS